MGQGICDSSVDQDAALHEGNARARLPSASQQKVNLPHKQRGSVQQRLQMCCLYDSRALYQDKQ